MSSTERLNWSLAQYSIGHLIASGHFGTVYQARHLPTGRDVALKLIPLHGPDSEEKVSAERHGAVLQQRFGSVHRGLVPEIFEHQTIAPFYAIAMELVQGRQLTNLLADGPVPSRRAAEIALAIAGFLEKAHRFETEIEGQQYALIVHADLKPDHILLLGNGDLRVLDFGIAKALAARTLVTTNKWGSVQYASPERLQSDGQVNAHADFWSLGVMLFEMLAGFRPYRQYEHNASMLDNAIRRQEPREPLPPHIEPALVAIVHKLLAPQAERRYQQADAIVSDLEAFLRGAPTVAGLEHAQASQETVRLRPSASAAASTSTAIRPPATHTAPTEPLIRRTPPAAAAQAGGAAPTPAPSGSQPPAATLPAKTLPMRSSARAGAVRVALIAALIAVMAGEGVSLIRGERLRAKTPLLEIADLPAVRNEYARLGNWAVFALGKARVRRPLATRLLELADRTILEYRNEQPAVAQAQWQQARDALDLAATVTPSDRAVTSRRAYVGGQLARIDKRTPEAIRLFHDAARLDPKSFDPYLGLAAVFAYRTPDLGGLTDAIANAERRGYRQGRRERAEFGDLHKTLADAARVEATRETGDVREEALHRAVAGYTKCIEYFDGLHLSDSESHLRLCRKRLTEVQAQLPVMTEPSTP